MIRSLKKIIKHVPKGVIIWCVCLGHNKDQLLFLLNLIKNLEPEYTYVFDPDLDEEFFRILDVMKDVTVKKEPVPSTLVLGSNVLIFAPSCPYTLYINLLTANLYHLSENFFIISCDMNYVIQMILDNIEMKKIKETKNEYKSYIRQNIIGASIMAKSSQIKLSEFYLNYFKEPFKYLSTKIRIDYTKLKRKSKSKK